MPITTPRPLPPGLRGTRTRRRVLELLEQHDRPLTIPEILAADNTLAQSSVYRNLTTLTDTGAVQCIPAATPRAHAHYTLAPAAGTPVHRICNDCSHIEHLGTADGITLHLDGVPIATTTAVAITLIAPCAGACNGAHR